MARWNKKKEEVSEVEVIADGVVRDDGKENPILDNDMERKPRVEGNWKKVTMAELAKLESDGVLVGYDQSTGEALVK